MTPSTSATPAGVVFADEEEPPEGELDAAPVLVRLNKYLADHGVASRRKCDELIAAGVVFVDGEPARELGLRIDPEKHKIEIDGVVLKPADARHRYYLLNKPSGVVCTSEERESRPRAIDLITDPRKGRIYTVGRLDEESKGLIILTNDGEFANKVMHPRYGIEKTYLVEVQGKIDDAALIKIREGVYLSEGRTSGARVLVNKRQFDSSSLTVTIREGMNREVRRSFARVGYKVLELRRVRIGSITDRGLKPGRWRELERREILALLAGEGPQELKESESRRRQSKRKPKTFKSDFGIKSRMQEVRARRGRREIAPRSGPNRSAPNRSAPKRGAPQKRKFTAGKGRSQRGGGKGSR